MSERRGERDVRHEVRMIGEARAGDGHEERERERENIGREKRQIVKLITQSLRHILYHECFGSS